MRGNMLIWLWMLAKRLLKKPSFLVILALIPVLTFGYTAATAGGSGVVNIALAAGDLEDPMASEILDSLLESGPLMSFTLHETPEAAKQAVVNGKADAAWVFPEDMAARVDEFLEVPMAHNAFVTVYQREDSVLLMLAKEKLNGHIFDCLSRRSYLNYLRADSPVLAAMTDEELYAIRDSLPFPESLFTYSEELLAATRETNYLTAPVRGLLAVVMLLAGLATAMYSMADRENGTFSWLGIRLRPLAELAQMLVSLTLVGIAVGLALWASGLSRGFVELPTTVLFILATGAFCHMLRSFLGTIPRLAAVLPLLLTLSLVICPVFFDLQPLKAAQYLLPPTYFITAPMDSRYLLLMLPYTAVCLALSYIPRLLHPEQS